jgi:hypothetical protein
MGGKKISGDKGQGDKGTGLAKPRNNVGAAGGGTHGQRFVCPLTPDLSRREREVGAGIREALSAAVGALGSARPPTAEEQGAAAEQEEGGGGRFGGGDGEEV